MDETNTAVIARLDRPPSIPETVVSNREAAAYWIARSSRATTVLLWQRSCKPWFQEPGSAGHSAATIASSPSVNAAGPGCRISGDLISMMRSSRTAGISFQPGRLKDL